MQKMKSFIRLRKVLSIIAIMVLCCVMVTVTGCGTTSKAAQETTTKVTSTKDAGAEEERITEAEEEDTEEPTNEEPTEAPTEAPTVASTEAPTEAPTQAPTVATEAPTVAPQVSETPQTTASIIGNANTSKYHTTNCGHLPKVESRVYFNTAAEAEAAGYTICGHCKKK